MAIPNQVFRKPDTGRAEENRSTACVVTRQPRREFTARTKRQAWERANGFCEGQVVAEVTDARPRTWMTHRRCNAPVDLGNFHYDHIDPDWFSKDNELDNCQVLCEQCHRDKTKRDVGNIAKSKRIIDKRAKVRKSKRPMLGSKQSGWKKTFSHGWVRR